MKLVCNCGRDFEYDSTLGGRTCECRYCGRQFTMPPMESLPPDMREEVLAELARQRAIEEKQRKKAETAARRETQAREAAVRAEEEARREEERRRQAAALDEARLRQEQANAAERARLMQQALSRNTPPPYVYRMVQVPPTIVARQSESASAGATYLERVVNDMVAKGWEFFRVDTIGVQVPPGCLGALLGQQTSVQTYYVISFRRPC